MLISKILSKKNISYNNFSVMIENKIIKIFGKHNATVFKNIIEKNNIIISGSFVLQILLNEQWNSDIDMYTTIDNVIKLESFFLDIMHENKKYNDIQPHYYNNDIKYFKKYTINNQDFELIAVNDPENYINRKFDFDILKNKCTVKNNLFVIITQNFKQIKQRTFEFKCAYNTNQLLLQKSIDRAKKYINRKFYVTFNGEPFDENKVKEYFDCS
jgi:hypothetical protein